MTTQQQTEAIQTVWLYSTINQFVERHAAFTLGGMRAQIFNEDKNGLRQSGAIVRNGRRVLINEAKYFAWLEAQNQQL
jgi:hypothetical protein